MLKIIDVKSYLELLKKRSLSASLDKQKSVSEIISNVIKLGDSSLIQYAKELDGVTSKGFSLKVSPEEKEKGLKNLSSEMKAILDEAYENITRFHQKEKEEAWSFSHNGAFLGQLINPIEKIGAYIPGGEGIYPSTVLMNCIPAQIADVPEIYIATPPKKDGTIDPAIIYAASLCNVKDIFKIGGAGAIAALAYGTETIPKVYKIVGPGNLYVTTAKKMVYGDVDIDMIAGPSEIMVLADEKSDIDCLTYDLFSQSEHSADASSIVLATSEEFAHKINASVTEKAKKSKRSEILTKALSNNGYIVIYKSLEEAYEIVNEYAPEHLEILIDLDYTEICENIKNVGSIFIGNYSPEPVGDYFSGTNHSLPTGGTAKFFSPLGVYDFIKRTSISRFSKERLKQDRDKIIAFAEYEGFYEHANSIRIRKF